MEKSESQDSTTGSKPLTPDNFTDKDWARVYDIYEMAMYAFYETEEEGKPISEKDLLMLKLVAASITATVAKFETQQEKKP